MPPEEISTKGAAFTNKVTEFNLQDDKYSNANILDTFSNSSSSLSVDFDDDFVPYLFEEKFK